MGANVADRPTLDVDALLTDPTIQIVVCCGSGGVGKTTTAAALAVRAAELGRRTVVLTIDPARRLAQSLGLEQLDNDPKPVAGIAGSLDAMMLDMKRTFDDVVERHTTPQKAASILANPFYQAMSTSFAGTSEYMAMEKLSQLYESAREVGGDESWDLIVVDTPPSRSALDFLDAPQRLSSFLDGRFIRLLTAPARAGGKLGLRALAGVAGGVTAIMSKLLGQQTLQDVQTFVAAMDSMFGGFRQRAEKTYDLLRGDQTAFVVVAAPDSDALREASFFIDRLGEDDMPLAGVVMNRVMTNEVPGLSRANVAAAVENLAESEDSLAKELLCLHSRHMEQREAEQGLLHSFVAAHHGVPTVSVPLMARDVADLDALRDVGAALGGSA